MAMDTYGIGLRVQSDMSKAQGDLRNMQGSLSSLIGNFAKVTIGVTSFTAVLMTMKRELIESYKASLQFNKGMANVATLIPGNISRIEELKEGIKSLSAETGKPLEDLTDGLYQVVSAFGDNIETQERLKIVSQTSVAGMSSTSDALNLLSAVTKAYGDTTAGAMQKVSDLAFLTLKWGQTSFPELANSIQQVTDSSVRLKVSQEELFAVFATLTGVSGDASTVATQLRSVLVALEGPSTELAKLYDELGVASGRAFIEQYGLQGALQEVIEYSERTGTGLQQLMGRVQAMSAAYNLGSSQAETYAWKLEEVQNSAGATGEAFAEISEGINKQGFELEKLKASWAVVRTQIGDSLQPVLGSLTSQLTVVVDSMIKSRNSSAEMSNALDNLNEKTKEYKNTVADLEVDIDSLSESERVLYDIRVLQHTIEMERAARELATAYRDSTKDIEDLEGELAKLDKNMDKHLSTVENATKGQWEWIEGWRRNLPAFSWFIDLIWKESWALKKVNEAQELTLQIREKEADHLEGLITLAKAVVDGYLDIEQYKITAPDFYDAVMEQVDKLEKIEISPMPPAKGFDTESVLDAFVGFSTRDLKIHLAKYESELDRIMAEERLSTDYSAKKAHYEQIIASLKVSIGISEAEYVDKKKDALSWAIKEVDATGEIGKLEIERLKALDEIAKANGENAELTKLVNTLYEKQKDLVKDSLTEQLDSQLFAIQNENELLDIERQREIALKNLNDEHQATEANIEKVNQIYDELRDKTLEQAKLDLEYRVQSTDSSTQIQRLEIERQKEIEETNRKYGEQIELINLINEYYDNQANKIKKNETYIEKFENVFKKAMGDDAYNALTKFQGELIKIGETVQSLSMIWSQLSSMMAEQQTVSDMQFENDQKKRREELRELENDRNKKLDDLRDENREQLSSLQEMYDGDAISYDEYIRRKQNIDDIYEQEQKEAKKAAINAENEIKRAQHEAEVEQFKRNKSIAISNAIIAGAQGIMQAWALGPIVGIAGSALIGGAMAYQIAQIESRPAPPPPKYVELAEGGVVTSPTFAMIGEGGESEAVVPLSKAKDYGFGGATGNTYNITGNTFVGVDGVDELIVMMERRKSILANRGVI